MNALSALVVDPAFALAFRVREPASAEPSAMLVLLMQASGTTSTPTPRRLATTLPT